MTFSFRPVDYNLCLSAEENADRAAVVCNETRVTYTELDGMTDSVAAFLQQCYSLTRGGRVLLLLENGLEFVVAYYAVMRAGGVVIAANPRKTDRELFEIIADAKPSLVVAEARRMARWPAALDGVSGRLLVGAQSEDLADGKDGNRWDNFERATRFPHRPEARDLGPEDPALIAYTSGSTGDPRGCVHTHGGIQASIVGTRVASAMTRDDVVLVSLPLHHVTGMQSSMSVPISIGATLVIGGPWGAETAADLIERHRVTCWRNIATMMKDFVECSGVARRDLTSLRFIGGGGAALPVSLAPRIRALTGLDYIEGYGMTETMGATHMNPSNAPKLGSIGRPLGDVRCLVLSLDSGTEVEVGIDGELAISAQQLFRGYLNREADTRAAFVTVGDHVYFKTGDIGHIDSDGYYYITDRRKRMINVSGFKVWPAEVEKVLLLNDNVAEAVVVPIDDDRRGQSVKAVIALKQGVGAEDSSDTLSAWCRHHLSPYKVPRVFEFVHAIPKSETGKIDFKALLETAQTTQ